MLVSVPPPLGGAEVAVTTPVAADRAVRVPAEVAALAYARSVRPTSAEVGVYVADLVWLITAQVPPPVSQRVQSYVYDVGEPLHVPFVVLSVWPCCAVALTVR